MLIEEATEQCRDGFLNSFTHLHPEDHPQKALSELTGTVCMDHTDFLQKGLKGFMCLYRSLYTLIDFKLLETSLGQIA